MKQFSKFVNAKYKLDKNEVIFIELLLQDKRDKSGSLFVNIDDFDKKEQFIKNLMRKTLELPTEDGFVLFNWFTKIEYKISDSIVGVEIQRDVEEFLWELKNDFLDNELRLFLSLGNNYTRAIYRLLITYQERSKIVVNLQNLMDSLKVPKSLLVYADFKRKVLNPAQQELNEVSDILFSVDEKKDGKKVTSLVFNMVFKKINRDLDIKSEIEVLPIKDKPKELQVIQEHKKIEVIQNDKKNIQKQELDERDVEIKRIVSFFDMERRKLQPNYVRRESSYNMSGEYLLRVHLKETGRTPQMFFDAIRWLFSNNPKASFHRQYIMNIGKLIEHFNTLEHQAIYSQEAIKFNEEAQVWYNIYKKQGLSKEEILEKLREGGYIK